MIIKPYNHLDKYDIYEYSKGLIGRSFEDIYMEGSTLIREDENTAYEYENKRRKGGLGQLIEKYYFYYEPNSESEPDFKEAGLELKVTPYKINKNKSISSKERMIISMINYFDIVEEDFYNSGAWSKMEFILMVFYLWDKEVKDRLDYKIDYVYLYHPPLEDLKIIIEDYNLIRNKVLSGEAHKLSEGDTMYLGAATKSSSSKDRTRQPYSEIMAKPRAFSFKNSYMTYILNNYVNTEHVKDEKILAEETNLNFTDYVLNKINKNIGKLDSELIYEYYDVKDNEELRAKLKSKSIYSQLAFRMLGIKSNEAEEFKKANIVVKTIRVEKNEKIIESISFPAFTINDLIKESWEESDVNRYFSETKFLFMIFFKTDNGYRFLGSKFWNMPGDIIDGELKDDWEKFVYKFRKGVNFNPKRNKAGNVIVYNDLPKKKDTNLLHVRPHASKGFHLIDGVEYGNGILERDSDLLPNGNRMTKQCFWLSNNYLEEILDIKSMLTN